MTEAVHIRWASPLFHLSLSAALLVSCTSSPTEHPLVTSEGGATQPPGDGQMLPEEQACERLRTAYEDKITTLDCGDRDFSCPGWIRPAAGCGVYLYDEETVGACEQVVSDYESCQDFENKRCIITAHRDPDAVCETTSGDGDGDGADGGAGGTLSD